MIIYIEVNIICMSILIILLFSTHKQRLTSQKGL